MQQQTNAAVFNEENLINCKHGFVRLRHSVGVAVTQILMSEY